MPRNGGRSTYSRESHREFLRKLEEERSARRSSAHVGVSAPQAKKASDGIKAKWYLSRGPKIGGVKIERGFFYAGSNMSSMVSPNILEPSMIDPRFEVVFPDDDDEVGVLSPFPCYEYLTAMQRGRYILFLASERTRADVSDIGYAFLYLYGIERRLVVDSKRPGEVSDDERKALTQELLRLFGEFGDMSASFKRYVLSLLLYDGLLFEEGVDPQAVKSLFVDSMPERLGFLSTNLNLNNRTAHMKEVGYEYMLLSRLAQSGIKFPEEDILSYSMMRMIFSPTAQQMVSDVINSKERFTQVKALLRRRYRNSALYSEEGYPKSNDRKKGRRNIKIPRYIPSNFSIRKAQIETVLDEHMINVETLDVPFSLLSDIALTCWRDIQELRGSVENDMKGILDIPCDVMLVTTLPKIFSEQTRGKQIASVSHEDIVVQYTKSFGRTPTYKSNGGYSVPTQNGITALFAAIGWQTILPLTLPNDKLVASWKQGDGDSIVVCKREAVFSKANGKQFLMPLFDSGTSPVLDVPNGLYYWFRLAWFYGWFLRECGDGLGADEISMFPKSLIPDSIKHNPSALRVFFAYAASEGEYGATANALTTCLNDLNISDVQTVMFKYMRGKYGVVIPPDVISAVEKVYAKKKLDKGMILYDYQAGDSRVNYDEEAQSSFDIDSNTLDQVLKETSGIQEVLNLEIQGDYNLNSDAIDDFNDYVDELEKEISQSSAEEGEDGNDEMSFGNLIQVVKDTFGNIDEIDTQTLAERLVDYAGLSTLAEGTNLLMKVNEYCEEHDGQPLVEVDGSTAYANWEEY